jgi:hypothetical protein
MKVPRDVPDNLLKEVRRMRLAGGNELRWSYSAMSVLQSGVLVLQSRTTKTPRTAQSARLPRAAEHYFEGLGYSNRENITMYVTIVTQVCTATFVGYDEESSQFTSIL